MVKTVALHEVSFEIDAGEFASVIGQSGSGKSTLLNLIGLLDTPTTGRIVLNGHDATAATRKQRAALRNDFIGFVFQFHYLLPEFSVLENVLMPGRIAGTAHAASSSARRGEPGAARPRGPREEERQRPLGRPEAARRHRPRADEPSGARPRRRADRQPRHRRTRRPCTSSSGRSTQELGTAFVIVTHDRSVAQQTDRILEISDGALLQDVRNAYAAPRG